MKVFEVVTEFCRRGNKEIEKEVQYVTSEDDNLLSVAEHFTQHCFEYEKDLISVREVLTVVQHIRNK